MATQKKKTTININYDNQNCLFSGRYILYSNYIIDCYKNNN